MADLSTVVLTQIWRQMAGAVIKGYPDSGNGHPVLSRWRADGFKKDL